MRASLSELIQATGAEPIQTVSGNGLETVWGEGVSIDSRTIRPGEIFVAIRGRRYDGHHFIQEAVQKGASAIVAENAEKIPSLLPPSLPCLKVTDTQKALGDLASFHRNRFSLPLVAVTGSNGKTTTKELIAHLLSAQGQTLRNEGTQNNQIGLPLTLFRLAPSHAFCVLELGMSRAGEIRRLSEISRPTAGAILNVAAAHLEFLGDLETVYRCKMELVAFLPKRAPLILNAEDRFLSKVRFPHLTCIRFGNGGDFFAQEIRLDKEGLRFKLNGREPVRIALFGLHQVENCLAAIAACSAVGMPLTQILERLESFRSPPGRMEVMERGGVMFVHDAYNANPESVSKALQSFGCFPVGGRRVFVLGDMLELGEESPRYHQEAGEEALRYGVDLFLTLGPLSLHAFSMAKTLGLKETFHFESHQELADCLKGTLREGDWVLIKGSRGMQMERILEILEEPSNP